VVFLLRYLRDPDDLGTMGDHGGGVVTSLSAVRPCRRKEPPKGLWTCLEVRT
jgi:hypothetical protein